MLGSVIGLQAGLQHSPYAFMDFPKPRNSKKSKRLLFCNFSTFSFLTEQDFIILRI
jgi:hypothetical protein